MKTITKLTAPLKYELKLPFKVSARIFCHRLTHFNLLVVKSFHCTSVHFGTEIDEMQMWYSRHCCYICCFGNHPQMFTL